MTHLTYNGQLRSETDAAAITNLERKGWQVTVPPSYDPATQHAPVWQGQWVVANKTAEELAAERAAAYPSAESWQVKVWLARNGVDVDAIPALFDQMFPNDAAASKEAKLRWANVPDVPRDHPLVNALGAAIGMTPEQIDAAWPEILGIH